ncbi:Stealth CR1 domain-containing protein [Limosilactobacillus reuteri]|uniref:Stealth CR1 domain-containing protein n=1 Tax=Limosilactobacillus reuteri TaxID=1598 RepID=UPI00129B1810|nr:Stealth CR1 domain-containing protein [Limosilactobacillus reuteri]MRG63487.1 capsule biosynthesis protein CapG [Limosilactobacillus reuteri]
MFKIDFVVTWVDGSDPNWVEEKNKYSVSAGTKKEGMNSVKTFRDWGTFKYWFRGVEKFAPWVNKVYLIVDNQLPKWINIKSPKLKIINHQDYMPEEVLPVFNSNSIESCLHNIKGLSEHFVYFNDDMFLTKETTPDDFFQKGLPCDIAALSPIYVEYGGTAHYQVNNMEIINKYFPKKDILHNSKLLSLKYGRDNLRTVLGLPSKFMPGFYQPHMPESFVKNTFIEVWQKEPEALKKTLESKFRSKNDTSVWLFRDWQLAQGNFTPRSSRKFGHFYSLKKDRDQIWNDMAKQKYKVMCINDDPDIGDYENLKVQFIRHFKNLLPERSSFEKKN